MSKSTKQKEVTEHKEPTKKIEVEHIEPLKEVVPQEVKTVVSESSEILFLRKILSIQHEGGWGKHLDGVIKERIEHLKA